MTGDQADFACRLQKLLPPWFDQVPTPVLKALLAGPAALLAGLYSLYAYAQLQTRILTATDGWLDLIAQDFFGSRIARSSGQNDSSFRAVILASLFPKRNTRQAITQVLTRLTGRAPVLIEPWNTGDTGVVDGPGAYAVYLDGPGRLGAPLSEMPYQGFVIAYRPQTQANANLGGPDVANAYLDVNDYLAPASNSPITDSDIIAAVESVRMANTTIWLDIAS